MDVINSSTNHAQQTTEIYIKKILAGNIGDVRARLINSIEAAGYTKAKDLFTHELDIVRPFPPLIERIVIVLQRLGILAVGGPNAPNG